MVDPLQKVNVHLTIWTAGRRYWRKFSTAFKNVYSAGVNAVSAKSFQQAFASPEEALTT
jgi:hypothetical protein